MTPCHRQKCLSAAKRRVCWTVEALDWSSGSSESRGCSHIDGHSALEWGCSPNDPNCMAQVTLWSEYLAVFTCRTRKLRCRTEPALVTLPVRISRRFEPHSYPERVTAWLVRKLRPEPNSQTRAPSYPMVGDSHQSPSTQQQGNHTRTPNSNPVRVDIRAALSVSLLPTTLRNTDKLSATPSVPDAVNGYVQEKQRLVTREAGPVAPLCTTSDGYTRGEDQTIILMKGVRNINASS